MILEPGYYKCKHCKDGKKTVHFMYKGKEFSYKQTCAECYGKGKIDWIRNATGRNTWFFDNYPPGSMVIDGIHKCCTIYDGEQYVDVSTERGEALYYELYQSELENIDE